MRILPGMYADQETGLYYNMARYYDPRIGRYINSDPIGLAGGMNTYSYVGGNPLRYVDPSGLTLQSNWNFFWDWALERGPSQRFYGPETTETQEMMKSPGAQQMREMFQKGGCKNIRLGGYSTEDAYLQTTLDPSSTAFQVGGFVYSATNTGNGVVTYRVYNQASMYSFFYHLPGTPHKPRGGAFPFMGNIDQKFEWTEPKSCECQQK